MSNSLTFPGLQNCLTIPGFPGLWEPCQLHWKAYWQRKSNKLNKTYTKKQKKQHKNMSSHTDTCLLTHLLALYTYGQLHWQAFFTLQVTNGLKI